jgi:CheY-like chemotaxis protein
MSESSRRVLLVCGDLFFSTQLRSSAEQASAHVELELQGSHAALRAATGRYDVVIVDLESPGLDIGRLMSSLPDLDRPRVIAFGPHVQEQRLAAARAAGCDHVVSRGQIARGIAELLSAP